MNCRCVRLKQRNDVRKRVSTRLRMQARTHSPGSEAHIGSCRHIEVYGHPGKHLAQTLLVHAHLLLAMPPVVAQEDVERAACG
eukprot:5253686-Prymnesium_polylepis.2